MKKGRYKYAFAEVPLYGSGLHIIIADDLAAAYEAAGFPENKHDMNSYGAWAWDKMSEQGHGLYALFHPDASGELVAHEAVHLTNAVFRRCCMKLDLKNDEPQAYLTGWIAGQIANALASKQLKAHKTITLL